MLGVLALHGPHRHAKYMKPTSLCQQCLKIDTQPAKVAIEIKVYAFVLTEVVIANKGY